MKRSVGILPRLMVLTVLHAACASAPVAVDPFSPPPPRFQDREWRHATVAVLSTWYSAFVRTLPRSVVLPYNVSYLEPAHPYSTLELKEKMPPADWSRLVAPVLGSRATMVPPPTDVVFVNPPLDFEDILNSHDLLGSAAAISSLYQLPFTVGTGVRALAEYRWFVRDRRTLDEFKLPDSMVTFITNTLHAIVATLPAGQRARAQDFTVTFDAPVAEQSLIWAQARPSTHRIALSPLLLRTVFLRVADSCAPIQWKYRFPMEGPATAEDGRQGLAWGATELFVDCFENFSAALSLPLSHELAHVVASDGPGALAGDEPCADRFSVAYVSSLPHRRADFALLLWEELLEAFEVPEDAMYFGFDADQSAGERFTQLKRLKEMVRTATRVSWAERARLGSAVVSCSPGTTIPAS